MKPFMIYDLIEIADTLDEIGLYKEADFVDNIVYSAREGKHPSAVADFVEALKNNFKSSGFESLSIEKILDIIDHTLKTGNFEGAVLREQSIHSIENISWKLAQSIMALEDNIKSIDDELSKIDDEENRQNLLATRAKYEEGLKKWNDILNRMLSGAGRFQSEDVEAAKKALDIIKNKRRWSKEDWRE